MLVRICLLFAVASRVAANDSRLLVSKQKRMSQLLSTLPKHGSKVTSLKQTGSADTYDQGPLAMLAASYGKASAVVAPTCSLLISDATKGCTKAAEAGIQCGSTWSQGCGPTITPPTGHGSDVLFSVLCPNMCLPNMEAHRMAARASQGSLKASTSSLATSLSMKVDDCTQPGPCSYRR
jgi:hypothetical protein